MVASPFHGYLINLRQQLPESSLYYLPQDEARRLVELSGQDFGYDDKRWERWGVENRQFLPGYERKLEPDDWTEPPHVLPGQPRPPDEARLRTGRLPGPR